VKVVSNASPLITLARIGLLDSLHKLFDIVHVSTEVYNEVVIATGEGLAVVSCIGILEELYRRGEIKDLRQSYEEILQQAIRVDLRMLQSSLAKFKLPPL